MRLLTTNERKYEQLRDRLTALGIVLVRPRRPILELQGTDFREVAAAKALEAARAEGTPVLVDDAGLSLAAFPGFPGPLTKPVFSLLGREGLERLVAKDASAELVCVIAWSDGERARTWEGRSAGRLELDRPIGEGAGPLSSWFVGEPPWTHRLRALEAFARDSRSLS